MVRLLFNTRARFRLSGFRLLILRQWLVFIKGNASHALDVFEIFDRHLGNWHGNLDAIHLMQVDLAIFQGEELGLDAKRL